MNGSFDSLKVTQKTVVYEFVARACVMTEADLPGRKARALRSRKGCLLRRYLRLAQEGWGAPVLESRYVADDYSHG